MASCTLDHNEISVIKGVRKNRPGSSLAWSASHSAPPTPCLPPEAGADRLGTQRYTCSLAAKQNVGNETCYRKYGSGTQEGMSSQARAAVSSEFQFLAHGCLA